MYMWLHYHYLPLNLVVYKESQVSYLVSSSHYCSFHSIELYNRRLIIKALVKLFA